MKDCAISGHASVVAITNSVSMPFSKDSKLRLSEILPVLLTCPKMSTPAMAYMYSIRSRRLPIFIKGGKDITNVLKKCLKLLAYLNSLSDFITRIVTTKPKAGPP
jgi:hypothetical protein